ncbi:5-oxoprolinase subunit PxpB [Shewanella gelidii]|uniref:Carboxyltransferase domain-containing protein n=1 Tax=Shewanella gelidii TaxID=1642821 RepID=A0A917NDI3_9GAMM|nr:5-oxoprolinase subunit PxpB [Shewanella gelidii]MCL1099418.1 5-oxoprolinase subunit PxpB [Shewanella gelidii]GGI91595.1 hypothetical protein GCM10009332_31200 [Shewanella gelidii]
MTGYRVYRLSERAIVLEVEATYCNQSETSTQNKINVLAESLRDSILPDYNFDIYSRPQNTENFTDAIISVVSGFLNLTLYLKHSNHIDYWLNELQTLWQQMLCSRDAQHSAQHIVVPVIYGTENPSYGPDLNKLAAERGLSPKQVVDIHCQSEYPIYFLGFQPGFAYLGNLDKRLHTPRLANPRLKIPAGSVAIGGESTGVYPNDSPGGWHIIGRTDLILFDHNRSPSCLFRPGDSVTFKAVSAFERGV